MVDPSQGSRRYPLVQANSGIYHQLIGDRGHLVASIPHNLRKETS